MLLRRGELLDGLRFCGSCRKKGGRCRVSSQGRYPDGCYNWQLGMSIGSAHSEYSARLAEWSRARDVLAGEDAIKAAAEKYLPRLDSQSDEEYGVYKARASFLGATSRTLEEYLDLVFRKVPVTYVDGCGKALPAFVADCDLWGMDFVRYARRIVGEVLSVGRAGSLVLWDLVGGRPWVSSWRAEDVFDWELQRVGERSVLVRVVLRDGERLRFLRMDDGACIQQFWAKTDGQWSLAESAGLKRGDGTVGFIPFVFHGPKHSRPEPDGLPLGDIITANLDHYRLDADYKHGLHFAALPTAWVTGFDKASPLRIGSSTAWVSDIPGATAGFLEFTGAGLVYIERAMERVERRMALLGARMLEAPAAGEGGQQAQLCGLGSVVASLNQSLTHVLQLARWWVDGTEPRGANQVSLTMNTDLASRAITAEQLNAAVVAWKAGAISRESLLDLLKRGEVLPDGRTVEQERALIHRASGGSTG
jgi:hypothetical protein